MNKEIALSIFKYNKKEGKLYWKIDLKSNKVKGQEAGAVDKSNGYKRFQYKKKKYRVHQIIFLIEYGYIPEEIDHINRLRDDNRISNLSSVTKSENQRNRSISKNNKSGKNGVCWCSSSNTWRAFIRENGKSINIGYFKNKEDAIKAREIKEKKLNYKGE